MKLNRRHLLGGVCATLGSTAGCANFERQNQPQLTIPELSIENKDEKPYHIDVLLLHERNPVFVRSLEVESGQYDGDDLTASGGRVWRDVATTRQKYTLYARIDREEWFSTQFRKFGSECVRIAVQIDQQGSGTFVYFTCYDEDGTTAR